MTCSAGADELAEELGSMEAFVTGFFVILWVLIFGIACKGFEILGLRFIPLIFSSVKLCGEVIWRILSGNTQGVRYSMISNFVALLLSCLMALLLT